MIKDDCILSESETCNLVTRESSEIMKATSLLPEQLTPVNDVAPLPRQMGQMGTISTRVQTPLVERSDEHDEERQ